MKTEVARAFAPFAASYPQMRPETLALLANEAERRPLPDVESAVTSWVRMSKYPPTLADFLTSLADAGNDRRRRLHPELPRELAAGDPFSPSSYPGMPPWAREEIMLLLKRETVYSHERRTMVWADGRNAPLPRDAR